MDLAFINNGRRKCVNLEICTNCANARPGGLKGNSANLRRLVEIDLADLGPYVMGGVSLKDVLYEVGFGKITHVAQWLSETCARCDEKPDIESLPPYAMCVDLSDEHDPKLILGDGGELADGTAISGVACFDVTGCQARSPWRAPIWRPYK